MDSYDILVIILSSVLAIFLVLSCVTLVLTIKLIKSVREAMDSARQAVENVEAITDTIKNVTNGSVIAGAFSRVFEKFGSRSKKRGR